MIAGNVRADGKAYTLYTDAPVAPLPEWIAEKIKPRADRPRRESTGEPVPLDWFKRALAATPYTGGPAGLDDRHSYQGWLEFAMAAHEAASGDEGEYMWAFIEWSLADPSPDWKNPTSAEYIERKWQSFTADPMANAAAVTRASWLKVLDSSGNGALVGELSVSDFAGDPTPYTAEEMDAYREACRVLDEKNAPARKAAKAKISADRRIKRCKDFLAYLPEMPNKFIYIPGGSDVMWSAMGVSMVCSGPAIIDPDKANMTDDELALEEFPDKFLRDEAGEIKYESGASAVLSNPRHRRSQHDRCVRA
jgi:hypothetical protein